MGIESVTSRIRHYLARFHRKTFCYSKALYMVHATTIFKKLAKAGEPRVINMDKHAGFVEKFT